VGRDRRQRAARLLGRGEVAGRPHDST
jgi:hypothetical protein